MSRARVNGHARLLVTPDVRRRRRAEALARMATLSAGLAGASDRYAASGATADRDAVRRAAAALNGAIGAWLSAEWPGGPS